MLSKETLTAARQELLCHKLHPTFWALTVKGAKALNEVVEAAEAAQKDDLLFRVAVEYNVDVVVTLKDPPPKDSVNACSDMIRTGPIPCSADTNLNDGFTFTPSEKFGITVRRMQKDAYANAKDHGFHGEDEVDFGTAIALIHSEASEALEAHRKLEPFIKQAVEKAGSQDVPYDQILRQAKELQKLAIASELADVLLRCGDTAERIGVDLDKAVREKMAFNKGRPFKHGGKAY